MFRIPHRACEKKNNHSKWWELISTFYSYFFLPLISSPCNKKCGRRGGQGLPERVCLILFIKGTKNWKQVKIAAFTSSQNRRALRNKRANKNKKMDLTENTTHIHSIPTFKGVLIFPVMCRVFLPALCHKKFHTDIQFYLNSKAFPEYVPNTALNPGITHPHWGPFSSSGHRVPRFWFYDRWVRQKSG